MGGLEGAEVAPEQWGGVPTATVSDCLGRHQAMTGRIHRLCGGRVNGPAWTVRTVAGDSRALHLAVRDAPDGSVLVVDAGGYIDRAVWGGILTRAAEQVGVTGLVVDGAIRDAADIEARGFPVFGLGTSPAGPHKGGQGAIGAVIQCGGVVVRPGDWILGDDDGVVVAPRDEITRVLQCVKDRSETERDWSRRIDDGESTVDMLNLDEEKETS